MSVAMIELRQPSLARRRRASESENGVMKIKQYVLFGIYSDTLEPDEISARVGLAADEGLLRASLARKRPVTNVWRLRSDAGGLTVDEHLRLLIARLEPVSSGVQALLDDYNDVTTRFEVIREFGAEDGEDEVVEVAGGLEKLAGQHQPLGWQLTREMLDFIRDVSANLWVDKYG